MQTIYTQEEIEFIKENYNKMTYVELTNLLNTFNLIKKDAKQVRTKGSILGLTKKKYYFNDRYFEHINTSDKAYWLGFIYADGYIYEHNSGCEIGIELKSTDALHLENFNKCLNGNFEIKTILRRESEYNGYILPEREISKIRIYSTKMFKDLNKLNIVQNKTYRNEYPTICDEYFFHFVRGFLDGDGCIYINAINGSIQVKFTNANSQFLLYLQDKIYNLMHIPSYIYKESENKFNLSIHKKCDVLALLNKIYLNSTVCLDRKYLKYKQLIEAV